MAGKGIRDIKRRMKSVNSSKKITKAYELVSSAKLRRTKNNLEKTREYFRFVTDSIEDVFHHAFNIQSDYLAGSREIKKKCYIVVTSNRGLCGGFNTNIIKEAVSSIEDKENAVLVTIGSKGRDFFKKRGYNIIQEYVSSSENISFLETHEISKPIIDLYNKGEIDELYLVYSNFISTLNQKPITVKLLPFDLEKDSEWQGHPKAVEYEPSEQAVFDYLVPKYVEIKIYNGIVESSVSEWAARRIAMENATDNAEEIISDLTLNFNRARQAAITQEIAEIVGGAEALK